MKFLSRELSNKNIHFIVGFCFHELIFRKLFQGRSFYYATYFKPELNNTKNYFNKPYDITLCAQRMCQGHDSDIRYFWFAFFVKELIR